MTTDNSTQLETRIMVSTPETKAALLAEQNRLVKLGIACLIFPCQQMADTFRDRIREVNTHRAAMQLAWQRQTDRNAKRRAKRRALVQAT
jgi:hypothetical protein